MPSCVVTSNQISKQNFQKFIQSGVYFPKVGQNSAIFSKFFTQLSAASPPNLNWTLSSIVMRLAEKNKIWDKMKTETSLDVSVIIQWWWKFLRLQSSLPMASKYLQEKCYLHSHLTTWLVQQQQHRYEI